MKPPTEPSPLHGPFLQIRNLVQEGPDHYRAYSAEGEFLLDLNAEGAEQVLASDIFRVTVTPLRE